LKTALVVLDLEPDRDDFLRGEIVRLDPDRRTLYLELERDGGVVEQCVTVPEDAPIFIITEYDDSIARSEGSFEDLRVGWKSAVHGMFEDGAGCFVADVVIGLPVPIECTTSAECNDADFCSRESCDAIGVCELRPAGCSLEYDLVCGCDGETHANECLANHFGTSVAHAGACGSGGDVCTADGMPGCPPGDLCLVETGRCDRSALGFCVREPLECSNERKPVCGCDGRTYRNACAAAKAGVVVEDDGACHCSGDGEQDCDDGQVCRLAWGTCGEPAEGVCVERPESCPTIYEPVCGCDGNTYDNACLALQMGVAVEHARRCASGDVCGGTDPVCPPGEICSVVSGHCTEAAAGTCVPEPWNCSGLAPVCGCDGRTYLNECEAASRGVVIASEGACARCGNDAEQTLACRDWEVCVIEEGRCDVSSEGFCIDRPEECPADYVPVCGCDGETYTNACTALVAGTAIDSAGECTAGD
jgi:hypothetical protein